MMLYRLLVLLMLPLLAISILPPHASLFSLSSCRMFFFLCFLLLSPLLSSYIPSSWLPNSFSCLSFPLLLPSCFLLSPLFSSLPYHSVCLYIFYSCLVIFHYCYLSNELSPHLSWLLPYIMYSRRNAYKCKNNVTQQLACNSLYLSPILSIASRRFYA